MLKVFKDGKGYPILNRQNFNIVRDYEGALTLSFDIRTNDKVKEYLQEEAIIQYKDNIYKIKTINQRKVITSITAIFDMNEWQSKMFIDYDKTYALFSEVMLEVAPKDWIIEGAGSVTGRRAIHIEGASAYEILMNCKSLYGIVYEYHIAEKRIKVIKPDVVQSRGLYITDELNLKDLEFKGSSSNLCTRLYARGKKTETKDEEGNTTSIEYVNFASINGGKIYVDNNDYSNNVITMYWQDDRYTDPQSLLDNTIEKLKSLASPERSYSCTLMDLSRTNDKYKMLDFKMYDKVTLMDNVRKTCLQHQIVQYTEYPDDPNKNEVVLSSVFKKITGTIDGIKQSVSDIDTELKRSENSINEIIRDVASNTARIKNTYTKGETDTQIESVVQQTADEINQSITKIEETVQKIDTTYYHAELICSGTSITRDNSSITMTVKLLDKSDEVTTSDSAFNWKRVSGNSDSDTAWNNAHKGRKSITITSSDLEASANFYCDISAPEWQGSTSAVTVVDEVKSQAPVGMLTPNLPTTQTLDENGQVTPRWGLEIIPSMTFGIFSPDIAEITTVWKRRINNDLLTDLTAKEVVKDNILTVTGDILSESVRSVTYYCYMQYQYSTCMAEKTFTLVKDGQSGTDGISIVSTATMYAVNSSNEDPPTTGWITSRPERSAGQYLWRKLRVTYSDGITTELEAECVTGDKGDKGDRGEQGLRGLQGVKGEQGIPGVKGTDGKTSYTHIAYSNSADGKTDFSVSDSNREYVGMYVDFVATDSTDPTKYAWSKIKGADGAQGTPGKAGADGKTPYLHIAYANNATGTSGFSTTDSTNKLYIGQYTDYISADSTEPSKYSWTKIKGETGPQGIQGIPGVRGADGISSYFHIRYSQNANGNPMSESAENAIYIGTCSTTSSTAPTSNTAYKWSKIKGETGQKGDTGTPGAKGADGKTSYLHIKYSNDGTSFTSNNGETPGKYIGTYVDFTEADSTTFSKYTWVKVEGPQGVQGPKGADGRQLYTWLKYADSPTSGMSDSPTNKAYIGLAYNKTTATESSNYNDYTWSLVKGPQGNQGVPGAKGADGKQLYTWIKYATSASGGGMSDDPTGKTYIGLAYNKETATESTNASDYTWSLIKGDKGDTGAMGPILSEGNCLYKDPTFINGINSIKVYNNSGGGTVTNTRIASSDDCPTQSEYMLEIKNVGTSSPGCGGFSWQNPARANAVFIYRIIAKIPVGRSLVWASNATGNGSVVKWLTSVAGTGKFQEYLCQLTCGSTGSFSSTGFFYINGAVGTASAPVLWYVAYATCYDMTDIPLIDVQKAINDATNNATAEINRSITSTNLRVDTLDTSLQTISETVTETSKELKTTSTKVLDIEKTVEGHKTSISKISTIENQLTGKVDIVELKVYCEFTENNNSPQLRLGSSATDTQSYITDNGFRVEYKGVVKTKVDASGLIADTVILKKADFGDNHAIYKNDKNFLIIQ